MNALWCASTMLASDSRLLASVRAVCKTKPCPAGLPPAGFPLVDQPDPAALTSINNAFRYHSIPLHLSVYDLSEINRWMVVDKTWSKKTPSPLSSLDTFWQAVAPIQPKLATPDHRQLFEAAGVLLADRDVRAAFVAGAMKLSNRGFSLPAGIEDQLQNAIRPPSIGNAANDFVDNTWPGSSCLTRMDFYDGYYHPNI